MDEILTETRLIKPARLLTQVFSPFYAPVWALLWLLFFSTYRFIALEARLSILFMVIIFTVVIPKMTLFVLRTGLNMSRWQFDMRVNRHIQYAVTFISSLACIIVLRRWTSFDFLYGVLIAALVAEIVCLIINMWWKISVHMVGVGGLVGLVGAFSARFGFDPVWPTCMILLLAGFLGSAQMFLRQHNLVQIIVGFIVGVLCARITFMLW